MKQALLLSGLLCAVISCTKPSSFVAPNSGSGSSLSVDSTDSLLVSVHSVETTDTTVVSQPDSFTSYIIPAGAFYVNGNSYATFTQTSIKFQAIFDSSCIYATVDPANQADINKLYGFADCGTYHQQNSARFGWNWLNGELHIHAYCYANGVRSSKDLGTITLNTEHSYSIDALSGLYVFTLDGHKDTMIRHCADSVSGYKLLPYFGGTEPAPHQVRIRIKEIQ